PPSPLARNAGAGGRAPWNPTHREPFRWQLSVATGTGHNYEPALCVRRPPFGGFAGGPQCWPAGTGRLPLARYLPAASLRPAVVARGDDPPESPDPGPPIPGPPDTRNPLVGRLAAGYWYRCRRGICAVGRPRRPCSVWAGRASAHDTPKT